MSNVTQARHRKAARPVTPLTGTAVTARRGVAVAASSGLALTMIASGAAAAGTTTEVGDSAGSLKNSSLEAIAENARIADTTNQAVSVSEDAEWEAAAEVEAPVTVEAPPEPEPVVEETVEETETTTTETATRSETRTETTTDTTSEETTASESESADTTSEETTTTASSSGSTIVAIAMQYQGAAYVYGATGPNAFDCSGFVQYVYAQAGISLPRTSYGQGASGTIVSASQAQPGDIVYYGSHVGIYAGNGMMIDAGNSRVGVSYRSVYGSPSYVHVG